MSPEAEHRCKAQVWSGYQAYPCNKTAKYEHEGRWYCKKHHPPTVEAKRIAKNEKLDRELAEWKAANEREEAIAKAKDAVIRAAEDWHSATFKEWPEFELNRSILALRIARGAGHDDLREKQG